MNLYLFDILASFEGEGGEGGGQPQGGHQGGQPQGGHQGGQPQGGSPNYSPGGQPQGGQPQGGDRTFTQEELNKFLAEDRRKHQEKYQSLEQSYQELLQNQSLSKEQREGLEQQLEDLRARHRTKEQQLAHEKKQAEEQYQTQLKEMEEKAVTWEKRYTESTINRELQSAAIKHDAFNPDQVVTQLRGSTSLVEQLDEQGKPTGILSPMVKMTVKNEETGISEQLQMTPDEAVEYMKKTPERWGNFFKNNIREGIGSTSATGGAMSGNGTIDPSKLSMDQYMKLRKENPAALGLKSNRRR